MVKFLQKFAIFVGVKNCIGFKQKYDVKEAEVIQKYLTAFSPSFVYTYYLVPNWFFKFGLKAFLNQKPWKFMIL